MILIKEWSEMMFSSWLVDGDQLWLYNDGSRLMMNDVGCRWLIRGSVWLVNRC